MTDLDALIPKSNADKSDDDEVEYDSSSESEEEPPKKPKKTKKSKGPTVSAKGKIKTKKPKGPSREMSQEVPPLHTEKPQDHAMEPIKPIFVKEQLDNKFNEVHQIDLNKDSVKGIAYKKSETATTDDPLKEMFDEEPLYKRKWFQISLICVVFAICLVFIFFYCKRKFMTYHDPVMEAFKEPKDESISGGSKKEYDLNSACSTAAHEKQLPKSYENSFYDDEETPKANEETANNMMKEVAKLPRGKESKSSTATTTAKGSSSKVTPRAMPARDEHGRFISSKK